MNGQRDGRRQARISSRGNRSPLRTGSRFPGNGVGAVLSRLIAEVNDDIEFNPNADPANHPQVRQEVAQRAVPGDIRSACRVALEALVEQIMRDVRASDKRMVRTRDIVGNPLEVAHRQLSRARQLTYASIGLLYSDDIGQRNQAEAMMFGNADTSACALIYKAYKAVREFELNPPPPLIVVDGRYEPNPVRVTSTYWYHVIMGTEPMEPNRLALGPDARAVWTHFGLVDPYHVDIQGYPDDVLYTSVSAEDVPGPRWVEAWARMALQGHERTPFNAPFPPPDMPDVFYNDNVDGWDGVRIRGTDMQRALYSVHTHIRQPDVGLLNPAEADPNFDRGRTRPQAAGPDVLGVWQGSAANDPAAPPPALVNAPVLDPPPPEYYPPTVREYGAEGRIRANRQGLGPLQGIRSRGGGVDARSAENGILPSVSETGVWSCLEAARLLQPGKSSASPV